MLLATILLMLPVPQTGNIAKSVTESQVTVSAGVTDSSVVDETPPSMPAAKVDSDGSETNAKTDPAGTVPVSSSTPGAESVNPNAGSLRLESFKVAYSRPRETPSQRKVWYGLLLTSHAAAGFDAWSTRRAVAQGYTEGNPLLRPFANSNAIYVATQVSPVVMDYLGKHMMVSQHGWIRKIWWLPQVAGSGFSIGAGVHNAGMVH